MIVSQRMQYGGIWKLDRYMRVMAYLFATCIFSLKIHVHTKVGNIVIPFGNHVYHGSTLSPYIFVVIMEEICQDIQEDTMVYTFFDNIVLTVETRIGCMLC